MNKKYNWLELAEFFSVGSLFFGVITTAITKQILFSLTPLSFVLFFNLVNRQRYNYQPDKILEQYQQTQDLHQDLITFSDDYKYQKLELEKLIEEAKKQRLALERKTNEYLVNTDIGLLLTQLNNLKSNQDKVSNYVYSELDKFSQSLENLQRKSNQFSQIQATINTLESRLKKIEDNESSFNSTYQSTVGSSSNLTGLSQYYPLQGLTQKLITEVKNEKDIKYFAKVEANKFLNENSLKYVQNVAKHSQWLSETVVNCHNNHKCSPSEAELLATELRQLAMELSNIRTVYDLRIIYKVVTLFTYQISRFKHYKKTKYCWDYSMRNSMVNVLNDCLAKTS
jgi:hypothetical protein